MKKLQGIIFISIFVSALMLCGYIENHYTRKNCIVIGTAEDIMKIKDECGFIWTYENEDNTFNVGDKVDLKMHTRYTDNIYDDEILKIIKK